MPYDMGTLVLKAAMSKKWRMSYKFKCIIFETALPDNLDFDTKIIVV